ncbi:13944_t:CDS:2 [Funneliformis caledonium]|uniref:13944_t:CDS:1 n=1 Tax=Funneliformis caledonium TaxID=1117310 RepID=A0A9N9ENX1_9GLOM|nr:13944_t:CDS:2 [Funneliformis caledonium]
MQFGLTQKLDLEIMKTKSHDSITKSNSIKMIMALNWFNPKTYKNYQ